ncbi:MAG: C25 family cysteine peptidase [candidate division WOR-3 bacterium]
MSKHLSVALILVLGAGLAVGAWQSAGGPSDGAQVKIIEQSSKGTTFEVVVPGVEVTPVTAEGRVYSQLSLPGEVMAVLEEGKPQVPKVSVLLGIPSGAEISVQVLTKETERLPVKDVYPLQPPLLDNEEPGPFVIDRQFYTQNTSYPGRDVAVINTGVWRDLAVCNLQVYPVQVNPAKGEIEVTKRIRVRVDYTGGSYPATVADWMIPFYAKYVDNFQFLPVQPQDYNPGVRYLVVCHQNYATNAWLTDSLLGYVKARGYDVRMIVKPSFTAQEIKDSIRAEYNRNNPKTLHFVLLVGEYGEIPMGSYSGVGRSDFWYSDLEPWPGGDNYPEVVLGRLSPSSQTDLANQITKILNYQQRPPSTNNWLDKLTMPAHSEQYPGKYSGCVRGIYFMPKPFWNPSVVETIMGYYTGNTTVTNALNAGRGIVAYRGHGDYTEWWQWGTEGSWFNSHVYALNNGDMTPVVYNIACNCGDIYQSECLSEAWMRKFPGGAVGNFGATQASYTYPNHGICSTLVRATCDTWTITVPGVRNYGPTPYLLSEIKAYGVDAYVAKYWPSSPYPYNIWMYVVLGDPSMPVWCGGMPQQPTVTAPDSIPLGPYNLNVTVQVGGRPVEGALVCAWKEPDFYVAERTDASGVATLAVNAGTPGQVLLTVSEGHAQHSTPGVQHTPILPYQRRIPAGGGGQPQPNLVYAGNQVIDSTGNNNGRFDPGETGKIYVTLRNTGNAEAQNVTARLKSTHVQFQITDSTAAYGNIPADSSRTNRADPFWALANAAIPPGTIVQCTLRVHSDNFAHDWVYTFNLQVGEPPVPGQFVIDLDTGAVLLSVCGIGSIGFDEPQAQDLGQGFRVPKTGSNTLFFGALMAGNSPSYLVDHFYGQPASGSTNHDWRMTDSFRMVIPPTPAHEQWRSRMNDGGHPTPKNLNVEQKWFMLANPAYDDWAIATFKLTNNGSQPINGLYVGMIGDFDIGSSATSNTVVSDTVRRAVYMRQSSTENPCVGLVLLSPTRFANIGALDHDRYVYPDSCVTDAQKFRILNGGIVQRNSNRAYDWSAFVSAGPFDLGVGGEERVAFAVVGATSASGFWQAADSAQAWFEANLLGVREEAAVSATPRRPLFLSPSLFRTGTWLHYYTSTAGNIELSAFDATGRLVVQESFAVGKGTGRLYWRPQGLSKGIYFLKVRSPEAQATAKFLVLE